MKQLTPSGWIGVLIGIVVFGSIVGRVTAADNCLKASKNPGKKIEYLKEITDAFTTANYDATCSDKCFQYYPPARGSGNRRGKGLVLVECATGSCAAGDTLAQKIGAGYQCNICKTDTTNSCKVIGDLTSDLTECYTYAAQKTLADTSTTKKHLCMDECHYFYASATDNLTVGCQHEIKSSLNAGVTTTKCPAEDPKCDKMISNPLCFAQKGSKLNSVEDITKAMARENWKVPCEKSEKCIQYYPPSNKAKRVGRAMALLECGSAAVSGADLTNKIGDGYLSHACDAAGSSIRDCKTLDDVKRETVECYDYSGEKNNADETTLKQKKIYCMDKCRFLEVGKVLTVACANEFQTGSPADCPDTDQLCAKMILKSDKNPDSPGGGGGTTGGSTAAPTKPKHGNRVTVPTCLIGSMAILLFAASQYVTFLN